MEDEVVRPRRVGKVHVDQLQVPLDGRLGNLPRLIIQRVNGADAVNDVKDAGRTPPRRVQCADARLHLADPHGANEDAEKHSQHLPREHVSPPHQPVADPKGQRVRVEERKKGQRQGRARQDGAPLGRCRRGPEVALVPDRLLLLRPKRDDGADEAEGLGGDAAGLGVGRLARERRVSHDLGVRRATGGEDRHDRQDDERQRPPIRKADGYARHKRGKVLDGVANFGPHAERHQIHVARHAGGQLPAVLRVVPRRVLAKKGLDVQAADAGALPRRRERPAKDL